MKKQIILIAVVTFSAALIFTACQKESSKTPDNTDNTAEIAVQSDDQSRFSSENDAVANDADVALESYGSISGRLNGTQSIICDATITVDSVSNPHTVTITYNGTNCIGNRTRTGVVKISMAQGVHWKDVGAAVSVTYQSLKITRLNDNKSITINGTYTLTNVSGGLLINLPALTSITHTLNSSDMSVTFDDGTVRNWQVARKRVYTYNNGVVITIRGNHTDGNTNFIAEWGTNRFGRAFTTRTTEPLIIRQDCNFRLTSGEITNVNNLATTVVVFGLDASGAPTSCPGLGNYYLKATWTGPNGTTFTTILPY